MELTSDHYRFWNQKKMPALAKAVNPRIPEVSVHRLIPGNIDQGRDASNLLSILKLTHKRGELLATTLIRLSIEPGTVINPRKRAAYCRRWLKRIWRAHS